jgi:PIN domain nuclease of toxin-antitoxin system
VRVLVDTHVLLWAATAPERLAPAARSLLERGDTEVLVSAVVAWEIGIKQSLGKLELPTLADAWLPEVLAQTGFSPFPVTLEAALRVCALPWHHRDPFDRLLVAQALVHDIVVMTHDPALDAYGPAIFRA